MKRELSPLQLALIMALGCILFRLIGSHVLGSLSNISPLMAVAFVGSMYLPRRWGWLVGPATLLVTELAFLPINYLTDGSGMFFSGWTLLSLALYTGIYAAAGGFGLVIARFRSLPLLAAGSLFCSLIFYVAANTYSWAYDVAVGMQPGYAPTLAGWWQANTIGVVGYAPAWLFLRNGMAGDLFFSALLLFVLDRAFLLGQAPARTAPRAA